MSAAHVGEKCFTFLWSAIFGHSMHSADNMEPPLDALRPSWTPDHVQVNELYIPRYIHVCVQVHEYKRLSTYITIQLYM